MWTNKDVQFMRWVVEGAKIFSTCSKRQYMALLVDKDNRIVGTGYNGGPSGFKHCTDGGCPRAIENSPSGSNYDNCISIHAEQNAFLQSDYSHHPTRLYVNGPPCFTCAKLIANSTVTDVYHMQDSSYAQYREVSDYLRKADVRLHPRHLPPQLPQIKTVLRDRSI